MKPIPRSLVFSATYNEVDNVETLIKKINHYSPESEILIIDDNSPDGTYDLLEKIQLKYDKLHLIKRKNKFGLDTAHKLAYDYALTEGFSKFITMDADLSHDPKEIPKMLEILQGNAFVIGARYIKGGDCDMSFYRRSISYLGNMFIKFILQINSDEFTSSFRGFNLHLLKDFHLNKIESKGYSFFMETIYLINKLNFKIIQIPIIFNNRMQGKSKMPRIELLRTLKNVLILFFK